MSERRRLLALVHIGAKSLGLDEDAYRALLVRATGKKSAAEMDEAELARVVAAMRALGFRPSQRRRPRPGEDRARLIAKVDALLIALGRLPRAYADGMARRMFGIARVEWLRPDELRKLVAALEYQRRRMQRRRA